MGKCPHQLIGPTNVKKCEGKKVQEEVTTLETPDLTKPKFVWTSEHHMAFDVLK